jgi:putative ABC transport system permease protein
MAILRRIANLVRRDRLHREIEAELAAHLAMRTEDNLAAGMSPSEARRNARLRLGNPAVLRERTSHADAALGFVSLWDDIRFALRQFRKAPGYALTAMLTLSLAIGANSAIFSVIRATLLRQLPFDHPERVYLYSGSGAGLDFNFGAKSFEASFNEGARSLHTIDSAAIYASVGVNLAVNGPSQRIQATETSAHFLDVLGLTPQLGRGFRPDEDIPGKDRVVLLSDHLWHSTFGASPNVVGKTLHVNAMDFTVIGVLPARMDFPSKTDLWTPTIFDEHTYLREGGAFFTSTIVRSKPGVTAAQLRAEFRARELRAHPGTKNSIPDDITPIAAELTHSIRSSLLLLFGASSLLLCIACANLAGLALLRGTVRRAEFAMRAALGASRTRILRQLLVESLLISLGGSALGLSIAYAALHLLEWLRPAALIAFDAPTIEPAVLAFNAGVALLSGLIFGILPGWQASRGDPLTALKAGVWRNSRSGSRLRTWLVGAEIAMAAVLLTGTGLLLRTIANLSQTPLGFSTQGILTFSVSLHGAPYELSDNTTPALTGFYTQVLEHLRALPGVVSAAAVSSAPLDTRADMLLPVYAGNPNSRSAASLRFASPGYFATLGMTLVKGRDFNAQDTKTSQRVVIITSDLAGALWPGHDPIGQPLHCVWYCKTPPVVIGTVTPGRRYGPRSGVAREYYLPFSQQDWPYATFVVRTQSNPDALATAIRHAVADVDPAQPVYGVSTMRQRLDDRESLVRFECIALTAFAALSGILAWIGLYGLIAYSVAQRTHEIGLRIALGARRKRILLHVLRESAMVAGTATVLGLLISLAATRLLSATLYGVTAHDPLTILLVTLLLLCASLLASIQPARRAAFVDPMEALRSE